MKALLVFVCVGLLVVSLEAAANKKKKQPPSVAAPPQKKPKSDESIEYKDPAGDCGKCPEPDTYMAHKDCSKFCLCGLDGSAWELECPEGLLYNEEENYCDYPKNVQCKGK